MMPIMCRAKPRYSRRLRQFIFDHLEYFARTLDYAGGYNFYFSPGACRYADHIVHLMIALEILSPQESL